MMAWIGLLGIMFDFIAYNLSNGYSPCKYNQPNSWKF
jgi:hypothetical protein